MTIPEMARDPETQAKVLIPEGGPADEEAAADLTLKSQRQRRIQLAHEASLLHKAGRTEELQRCLEALLEIDPNDARALYNLALLANDAGEKPRAERLLRKAITCDPDYIDAYQMLGDLHFQARHLLSAIELYERGLRQIPTRLPLLSHLLHACATMRSPHRVEAVARRILNIDDQHGDALNHLGWALMRSSGDLAEADRCIAAALALKPESPSRLALAENLAELRKDQEGAERHHALLGRVVAQDWDSACKAADTFISLNRMDRAAEIVRDYVRDHPEDPAAHRYLAVTLMQDGDFAGSHAVLEQIMEIAGDKPNLQMIYCLNAFRLGDLDAFYRFHHTRWGRQGAEALWTQSWPEWDGKPISSGKLMVQCEQGVGDYVMFAVCFPGLRGLAKDVIVKAMGRLQGLMQRSFPEFLVIPETELPNGVPEEAVAARIAAGDLPFALGGDLEHLPGKGGVLVADPAIKHRLRKKYEEMFPGKRLIGISWRSGNRDSAAMRSLDLPYWKPLFDLSDCAFISLQYGDVTQDLEELKAQLGDLVYWDKEIQPLGDMDPFTAQVSAMDLVISVDNSTVHFAGGLGKPCWAMLPLNSDWRWQVDRSDTVWYDSVELFRPEKESGWDGLIERVARRLADLDDAALKEAETAYLRRALGTMMDADRTADAEQYGRMLLAAGEHKAEAMRAIARSALAANQAQDAVAILNRAAELDPGDPRIQADLAVAMSEAGASTEALQHARETTRRFPKSDEASIACGRILTDLGRRDEATDFFARVLRRNPANVKSRLSLAGLQAAQSDWDLARGNYHRVLQEDPANAAAHTALAEIALRLHQWDNGWQHFRWRYGVRPGTLPGYLAAIDPKQQPARWAGGSLRKARLLLTAERNILEQLLLLSTIPDIAKESRKVTLECDARLTSLVQAGFPAIDVVDRGVLTQEAIAERRIQTVSNLGELASRFRSSEAAFPKRAGAFLGADPTRSTELRAEYQANFPNRLLVGLAWRHGKATDERSSRLGDWLPLLDRPEFAVVALHLGNAEAELAQFAAESGRDLISDRRLDFSRDLGDFAAQVQACDAVIAVEDFAALVAGGLGRPVVKVRRPVDHWWWGAEGAEGTWVPAVSGVTAVSGIDGHVIQHALDFLDRVRAKA